MANADINSQIRLIGNVNVEDSEIDFSSLTNAFRALRNFCATGKTAQDYISHIGWLIDKTKELILLLLNWPDNSNILCLLVSLQFVANYLVEHRENELQVWRQLSSILEKCLTHSEPKIKHCTTMIIYNVLLDNDNLLNEIKNPLTEYIDLTQNDGTAEYSLFILELFVCKTQYVTEQFEQLTCEQRLVILSVIESIQNNPERRKYPSGMISFLSRYFVRRSRCILETAESEMVATDAHEVAQVLSVVNSVASSNDEYLREMQTVEELLVSGIGLLKTVHDISKERGNQFSMLLKLAELDAEPSRAMEEHPGFGFKAALVRLVGNLCWKHQSHQDTAREMGAIPLILDCCNIDARNPLIIQWAVLAMRNLCEGNVENQRVVASVDRTGQVDSGRLAELGLVFNGGGRVTERMARILLTYGSKIVNLNLWSWPLSINYL